MPLILAKKPLPLISPPTTSPDDEFFVHNTSFNDGNKIWWSYPQPDRLTVVGWLRKEHFKGKANTTNLYKARVKKLGSELGAAQKATHPSGKAGYVKEDFTTGKTMIDVRIALGDRDSFMFIVIERIHNADPALVGFKMRLDFNPRKIGPDGFDKFLKLFTQHADVPFSLPHFLADAWVTRLDVAIDYGNVFLAEMIVTSQGQGKTLQINGADGVLETVQVHRMKKVHQLPQKTLRNPMGSLIVKLYDRNRERLAHGKPAPYDAWQVTRLERVSKKKNGPTKTASFLALPKQANPFKGVKLSYMPALVPGAGGKGWRSYAAARRSVGHAAAVQAGSISPARATKFKKLYDGHPSNLLSASIWSEWQDGLEATGLKLLIDVAQYVQDEETTTKSH